MARRFNMTPERAEQLYFEAQALPGEGEANAWIAPWPGFVRGLAGCSRKEEFIQCGNGITVNLTSDDARVDGIRAAYFNFINRDGEFVQRPLKDGDARFAVTLIPQRGGEFEALAASPELASSMFTRMFFMEGHGLRYFRPFRTDRQVTGGIIHTYKADWDGGEPNVMAVLKPREKVEQDSIVSVNYLGWLDDGTIFDTSMLNWQERGITKDSELEPPFRQPPLTTTLGKGGLIPGFEQGLLGMKLGEVKVLDIPPELGYGTDPGRHQLGNKTLHFRVRVEDIR
jgi:hypothetical protein